MIKYITQFANREPEDKPWDGTPVHNCFNIITDKGTKYSYMGYNEKHSTGWKLSNIKTWLDGEHNTKFRLELIYE